MAKRRSLESILKAMRAAGLEIARVEDTPEKLTVFTGKPGEPEIEQKDLDKWLGKHHAHQA